ncbi:MAG TPA: DUF58 domain-containing protein [Thermoanaerobaculia bacterium]|nr:DUF58 domain-containing protein [Thermoanaerobaculia bacterium]
MTARLVRAGFAGDYHAAFHGQGIEFSQVREYQPGDDVRTIDWNVTARSGSPHVKEFVEERDLSIMIAADLSGSMAFGSLDRRKIDLAREIIAVLAFAAEQNRDRVGLLMFNSEVRRFIPARRGRSHVQLLVRSALADDARRGTVARFDLLGSFLNRVTPRRSIVIVLSDFLDPGFEASIRRMRMRHDLIAISIVDPRERYLPPSGLVKLSDAESGRRVTVDLAATPNLLRLPEPGRLLKQAGIDFLELSTAIPYEPALLKFFHQRTMRRR